jgi:hypothetical protein
MTPVRGFAHIGLSSARWALPWIGVLFVSLTLAHAMSAAIDGWATAGDRHQELRAAASTTDEAAATGTPLFDPAVTPSAGALGVTSPASTGHATSNGCCTWD